ncbi:ATP-binding protein, partial [Streptomyces sp. SID9727]|nr:ATP-binding protein [Streptomyces sp. SID9727]
SRRRRTPRRTPAAATADRAAGPSADRMPRTPEAAGASWAALQQGTLNGRSVAGRPPAPDTDAPDHQDEQGDDEK